MRIRFAATLATALALAGSGGGSEAAASTATPLEAELALANRVDQAIQASQGGDPSAMQARYDVARDLAESMLAARVPISCEPLAEALTELASREIKLTEAFDRLRPWRPKEAGSQRSKAAVTRAQARCKPGAPRRGPPAPRALKLPGPGEVFFGVVDGSAPVLARRVLLNVNGVRVGSAAVVGGHYKAKISTRPGAALVEALFLNGAGTQIDAAVSRNAWVLPRSATIRRKTPRVDRSLAARFSTVGLGFNGYAAIHFEDLRTGRTAGWNNDARFPAASTVKLAVMVEAARRFGLAPASRVLYDVEQIGAWSSNLAANRLLKLVGRGSIDRGVNSVTNRLRALGATTSSYPGEYRAGTAHTDSPRQPPLQTARITTARDLATVLGAIHLAATGDQTALRTTGLRAPAARILLRTLIASEPRGENLGLVRPSIPLNVPLAQKQGWLSDTRATVAMVYRPSGPAVLVVVTHRPGGLTLREAQQLGARVTRVAGLG